MKRTLLLLSLTAGVTLAADAAAEVPPRRKFAAGSEIQLFVENDMLARTDRYYTNGIKVGLGLPLEAVQLPAEWVLDRLAPDGDDVHLGLFVGQNLYTPQSITVGALQPGDRPWAAWLYAGGVAQRVRGKRMDTVEVDLGVVGPAALGRQVQSSWHRLIGSPQPVGWHHQLPSEPAFAVSYLQKRRIDGNGFDVVPHAGVALGTVMTLARIGGIVRLGQHMSGFGPDTIEPGGAMLQALRGAGDVGYVSRYEWYLFAGVDHRFVARNIFIDGTWFHRSPSVERRPHVFDVVVGASLRIEKLRLSLTRVRRSEEFIAVGGGGRQVFDSLNLGWEF
ncbi:MAG: lipid A deacylase LpxR family protein [Rhodocyclales bacterium]|nr:lipid A deacylase LpxR family protein [Rhodocyclales bacterium]